MSIGAATAGAASTPARAARTAPWLLAAAVLGCAFCLAGVSTARAAPAWLAPADLSAPGKNASNPAVAMDDAGGAVAIWERQNIISHNVQVSTRSPGGAFAAPVDLSVQSQNPEVAMTPGGEAVAAWWHFVNPPGSYVLQVSTRPPGGAFSPPVDVVDLPVGAIPSSIQLAVNAAGATVLAWARRDPSSVVDPSVTFVESSVRPPGGSFSTPAVVSPLPLVAGQSASAASAAVDGSGEATVAWRYNDGADQVIQVATRPVGGEFSSPETLSESGEDASFPALAVDSVGNAIATWSRADGEDAIVQASARSPGGEFSMPPEDLSESGADAFSPQVAMAPAGEATVLWVLLDGGGTTLQASTRPPGGALSAPVDLSVEGEEPASPAMAMSSGGALVTWSAERGADRVVRATTRPVGAGFGAAADVSSTSPDFFHPAPSIGATGDATVVWTRSNGANDIVQFAGFDAGPPLFRGLSIPPRGEVGEPVAFSADPFDVWPISSTSFSFGDGGEAQGGSVSHVYSAPGKFSVTVTARDAAGTPISASGTIEVAPSYDFRVGKRKRNTKRGTATLTIVVPGPGRVVASGKAVKKREKQAKSAGPVVIPILAKGKALKRLAEKGKARVRASVSFTPDGGDRSARLSVLIVLAKKLQAIRPPA